jgi:hypothetical protein
LTIIALLRHSLANLHRNFAQIQQQKTLRSSERSYGFCSTLIAARLQEAELLAAGYVPEPNNAAAGEPARQFKGWAYHR